MTATARPVDVSSATDTGPFQRILLASEGRPIPNAAVARVVASHYGCQAIVMAADPDRARYVATAMWSQEPQRVRRKAGIPVFLVPAE